MRWFFQYLPHDVWDLSGGSPPILINDGTRKLVAHAGRTGWLYVVDAASGSPILRSDNFVPQANLFTHPTSEGIRMLPGANGGADWSPSAFSPRTGLVYVTALHQPMIYSRAFQPREDGRLWIGGRFLHVPDEPQSGILSAIDPRTGDIRWQRQLPAPTSGGVLVTAGDLVFVGQATGTFDAFDAETGQLLWQFRAGAGVNGSPITYMAGGVQYVAVPAGGNYQLDTPRGDDLSSSSRCTEGGPRPPRLTASRGTPATALSTSDAFGRSRPPRWGRARPVDAREPDPGRRPRWPSRTRSTA